MSEEWWGGYVAVYFGPITGLTAFSWESPVHVGYCFNNYNAHACCFILAAPVSYPNPLVSCPSLPLPSVGHLISSFEQLLSPYLWFPHPTRPHQPVFVKFLIKFIDQEHFWYVVFIMLYVCFLLYMLSGFSALPS